MLPLRPQTYRPRVRKRQISGNGKGKEDGVGSIELGQGLPLPQLDITCLFVPVCACIKYVCERAFNPR